MKTKTRLIRSALNALGFTRAIGSIDLRFNTLLSD